MYLSYLQFLLFIPYPLALEVLSISGSSSLSPSLSRRRRRSLREPRSHSAEPRGELPPSDPQTSDDDSQTPILEQTTATTAASENRLKNFQLIKTKLGPRRKRSPDDEDIDLITECLAEDDSRDLWFDLPHARVQEAIRDSTAAFKKGSQFKTELISELDKATRTLRASVRPETSTFDNLNPRMGDRDR